MQTDNWRIKLEYAKTPPADLLAMLSRTAGDHPPKHPDVGSTSLYAEGEAAAQATFAQACDQAAFQYVILERWDNDLEEWVPAEHVGAHPAAGRPDRLVTRNQWRFIVGYSIVNLLGGLFTYFVPGAQYAPGAGHLHDLGWTIGVMFIVNMVAAAYYLLIHRPSRRN